MGDFTVFLESLHLGLANTVLLIVLLAIAKKKLCQHEAMYEWYLIQRAIQERETRDY